MSWTLRRRLRAAPFFLQTIGLVIVSLVATQAISLAVILLTPPPPPELYRFTEVQEAVQSQAQTATRNGRPLIAALRNEPPRSSRENRRRAEFRASLARALSVDPDRVVLNRKAEQWLFYRAGPPPLPRQSARRGAGPQVMIQRFSPPQDGPEPSRRAQREDILVGDFELGVAMPDGRWLIVKPKPTWRPNAWQTRLLLILGLSIAAVTPVAWWSARRLSAPLVTLAGAAERLGRDPNAPPLPVEGAAEVAAASAAFNRMQERLRRYVDDRTSMIAAIAHDLRTPLTRLRFRIEAVPEDIQPKLAADIEQMEAMIAAAIAYVRDAAQPAQRTQLELASLLESVMDDAAETGGDARVASADRLVIEGDPLALRRMLANLVDNALKYAGSARGVLRTEPGAAVIEISDDGPGVRDADAERLFEPFQRGEPSRNRQTGGMGLGLAVVRSIARAHGGEVALLNREGGGLTAQVWLPL